MDTLEYLAACKVRLGIDSDYALAKRLGISHSAICGYRAGTSRINDDVALSVAEILGLHPLAVIAQANAERAKTPELRDRWMGVLQGFLALLPHAKTGRGHSPAW